MRRTVVGIEGEGSLKCRFRTRQVRGILVLADHAVEPPTFGPGRREVRIDLETALEKTIAPDASCSTPFEAACRADRVERLGAGRPDRALSRVITRSQWKRGDDRVIRRASAGKSGPPDNRVVRG